MSEPPYVRWFSELGIGDVASVGGKNASLGEMYRELRAHGVSVPNGFAVTAEAYRRTLDGAGTWGALHDALDGLDPTDPGQLAESGERCREAVYAAGIPDAVRSRILESFEALQREYGNGLSVAVRSSATAEDLPTASFAGQHDSFLNVSGGEALIDACRRCFASLFTDRAIRYRETQGFDHFKVLLSVGVMKMVRADEATSGVMFTLDTESGFPDVVMITGAYGLGETVVQGTVDPDEFYVHKPTYAEGHRAVLRRTLGTKRIKRVYADGDSSGTTRDVDVARAERERYCISDEDVLELAGLAMQIEAHYSAKAGRPTPLDIEWARDAEDGRFYIVQTRPETVSARRRKDVLVEYVPGETGEPVVSGRSVGGKMASGPARVILDTADLGALAQGEVLVARTTSPDWGPVLGRAAAIVTEHGGRTCHAAIVARELDIPAVVGAEGATTRIADGEQVTVSCAQGDVGRVYAGAVPFEIRETDLSALGRPATKIMVNLGNPQAAFRTAMLPNDGVGLARLEFIIGEYVKAHPMALAHPEKVSDPDARAALGRLCSRHASPAAFFVETLSEGVGTIAAAFYPKPVIVRLSDFKTNEYASLLGGRDFEPVEANPMLGFRGAARYDHPAYADGFALECAALARVRDRMGLTNVKIMVPFCRRAEEAARVIAALARHGLERGKNDLEIYVMCEIPNNVISIDAFARHFDGFSIGSNDLTQLTLGVDRDSDIVAFDFDERDPGMKAMLRLAVEGARRNHKHVGICGQAPSDYPEIAEFLVALGIDSISLTPDAVPATWVRIVEAEKMLAAQVGEQTTASAPAA